MSDHRRSEWLTVEAAAKRLGVSAATVKRRIGDGKPVRLAGDRSVELEAEMIERPQGHEWRVRITGELPPLTSDHERGDTESTPLLNGAQEDSGALLAALDAMTGLVADVRVLERENGALRAERDAAEARAADLADRLAQAEAKLAARRWWRFWGRR